MISSTAVNSSSALPEVFRVFGIAGMILVSMNCFHMRILRASGASFRGLRIWLEVCQADPKRELAGNT